MPDISEPELHSRVHPEVKGNTQTALNIVKINADPRIVGTQWTLFRLRDKEFVR